MSAIILTPLIGPNSPAGSVNNTQQFVLRIKSAVSEDTNTFIGRLQDVLHRFQVSRLVGF